MFVFDAADDFLEDVFQRNDPHDRAIFVDHDRKMLASRAKGLQLIQQSSRFRDEPGFCSEFENVELRHAIAMRMQLAQ